MTDFTSQQIPYSHTMAFSAIVTDYVAGNNILKPFYQHAADVDGIKNAIEERKNFATNRSTLVSYLKQQYAGMPANAKVQANIDSLLSENCFTITTAHQPNIFTGHLYFVYKILHAIKMAEELTGQIPGCHFVPVYYMGSEDADLEELGEVNINGKKYTWQTKQQGAVGRMKIDKAFADLTSAIEAQVSVEPFGKEIMEMVNRAYVTGKTVEQATFEFVNELFAGYGLLVLLPDRAVLKKEFAPVIKKELAEQFSQKAVTETMNIFPAEYKVQAAGRETNLFYLKDNSRERIEKVNNEWLIVNTDLSFSEQEIFKELDEYPERFSPNVILRPLFQELVLPNVAFIGGGGELAYWLELKKTFEAAGIPYPVLVLRNSFMFVSREMAKIIAGLQLNVTDFFMPENVVISELVKQFSGLQLELTEEKQALAALYQKIKSAAAAIDSTLQQHVDALHTRAGKKITQLEKKMLTAEKKKYEAHQRQVTKIKSVLFPTGNLQERVDNIIPYYAVYGKAFIEMLYKFSTSLQQEFCIITERA